MEPMSAASGGMQTIYCSYCSVQLSFPRGSMYIQCPRCQATQNPHAPQQTVCIGCGTLLAHPANSLYIQCPKCMITQNARENRGNVAQNGAAGLLHDSGTLPQKTPKKKKDPNAPKAASNAYMIFCKERRAELKQENPSLAFGKIGAKLGEIWRTLSSEEKRPYEERASNDRERYRRQMESYKADGGDSVSHDRDGEETDTTLSKKRSTESLETGGLQTFETSQDIPDSKRLKVQPTILNDLAPEFHDVGLYGHNFGGDQIDSVENDDRSGSLGGFGDQISVPTPAGGTDQIHSEPNRDILDVSGVPDPDVLDHDSNDLGLNVHHGLTDPGSEEELSNSPDA